MIKFGTGGWRAIIGDDFIKDNIQILTQAVANDIKNRGLQDRGIVVGYDRRFLSDKSAKWVVEVMAGNGIKTYFIPKISPTPLIMYTVKELDTFYGMAVTASHNPADYNGIKVFTEGGRDADKEVTDNFEIIMEGITKNDVLTMDFSKAVQDKIINIIDPFNKYIDNVWSWKNFSSNYTSHNKMRCGYNKRQA
jgi:phosphomannomutase